MYLKEFLCSLIFFQFLYIPHHTICLSRKSCVCDFIIKTHNSRDNNNKINKITIKKEFFSVLKTIKILLVCDVKSMIGFTGNINKIKWRYTVVTPSLRLYTTHYIANCLHINLWLICKNNRFIFAKTLIGSIWKRTDTHTRMIGRRMKETTTRYNMEHTHVHTHTLTHL